jgi:hypothetical protein
MMRIIGEHLDFIAQPVFSTIRSWVLRIGLYLLNRPKPEGEWIYIIDASIQMGAMKCLLILGIRQSALEQQGHYTILHQDVEPLVLKTVKSCSGEVVQSALVEAEAKTGMPLAVLSDEGSELKRGVKLFNAAGGKTVHLFDIVHRVDLVVKKEVQNDMAWQTFAQQMTNTIQQLKLTDFAHFIPPKQRQKKRMLNEITIVKWGSRVLRYLDQRGVPEEVFIKLQWLRDYRGMIWDYRLMMLISKLAIREVRQKGYYIGIKNRFKKQCEHMLLTPRARAFYTKIEKILEEEESKVSEGICLPGTSEVIESLFGKFKQLEKDHAAGGLTTLVLGLPALMGKLSITMIQQALDQMPVRRVSEWIKNNLGTTFWSKRRRDLGNIKQGPAMLQNYLFAEDYLDMDELPEVSL